jgi:hypothetical protein
MKSQRKDSKKQITEDEDHTRTPQRGQHHNRRRNAAIIFITLPLSVIVLFCRMKMSWQSPVPVVQKAPVRLANSWNKNDIIDNHSSSRKSATTTSITGVATAATATAAAAEYQAAFDLSTIPDPNERTLAMSERLYSGFRNQGMAFTAFIMYASDHKFTQILLPSLFWHDLFGKSGEGVLHEKLFDVLHLNTFSNNTSTTLQLLPRLVRYHPKAHRDFNITTCIRVTIIVIRPYTSNFYITLICLTPLDLINIKCNAH